MQWENFYEDAIQVLCPPGNGVFTVNTAKERKEILHAILYPNQVPNEAWKKTLKALENNSEVHILGVPSDCGGGIQRGANWGPLFLRQYLIENNKNLKVSDLGDIRVIPHLLHDKYLNDETIQNCQRALYSDSSNKPVSPLSLCEYFLNHFYNCFPQKKVFAIGGDHSVSYPLVKSYLKKSKLQNRNAAVIHFDAHTDLLVERLGIDLCFGSWATHVLDDLNDPSQMIQIGIRSTGKPKEHWEKTFGVKQYWASDVLTRGPEEITEEIIQKLKSKKVDELYISFDIDALDSKYASATGTPEPDGLEPHHALMILRELAKEFPITGADLVEIAPYVKIEAQEQVIEPDSTLQSANAIAKFLLEHMQGN